MANFKKLLASVSATAIIATQAMSAVVYWANASFDPEFGKALTWMNEKGLTKYTTEDAYRPYDTLTREQAAKFFSEFAKAMWKTADENAQWCDFSDLAKADASLKDYITSSCKLGLMKGSSWKFMPSVPFTKAAALTVLVRTMVWTQDETVTPWWDNYYKKAKELGLTKESSSKSLDRSVLRWEVALMLYRAANPSDTANTGTWGNSDDLGSLLWGLLGGDTWTTWTGGKTNVGTWSTTVTTGTVITTGTTVTTWTASTWTTLAGTLEVALNPATPAQGTNVPMKATVVVWKFDFKASSSDITVNTATIKRDGLGSTSEIQNLWFESNGVRLSTKASISSDNTAVLSFLPAMVVKANATSTIDLVAELSGSTAASQHRFMLVAGSSISSSASNIAWTFPVATNTVITANYTSATITVSRNAAATSTAKVGDNAVVLGDFMLSLWNENRDVKLLSVTLYNSGTADLAKSVSNLALYNKATWEKVSTGNATISGRYVTFVTNDTILYTASNRSYQVKWDIASADRASDSVNLSFDNKPEYLVINEKDTWYRAVISGITSNAAVYDLWACSINLGDLSIVKDTTASSQTVAKNTSDVLLMAWTIKTQQPVSIQDISVSFTWNGWYFASWFTRVKLVVGNVSAVKDAANWAVTFQNTYTVSSDTPIKVYWDVRSNAVAWSYQAHKLTYSSARYVSNDQAVSNSTNAFDSNYSNTISITVSSPTVTVSNNGSASSAQTVIWAKDLVLAKMSLINNNLSDITVSSLWFTTTWDWTNPVVSWNMFTNTSVDLVVDGTVKESKKFTSSGWLTFSSTTFSLAKWATKNIELRVASIPNSYGTGSMKVTFSTGSFVDSVGQNVTVNGVPSGTSYVFNDAWSVTFAILSSDNPAKILTTWTWVELWRFSVSATNDSVKITDLYVSFTGITDASAYLSNVWLYTTAWVLLANGSIVWSWVKFAGINSSNGFEILRWADSVALVVKANILPLSTANAWNTLSMVLWWASLFADSNNVADNASIIRSSATSQYLSDSSVTTPSTTISSNRVANSKVVVASASSSLNDEHRFTVTADSAGKVALTAISATLNTGTSLTGTLYMSQGSSVNLNTANQVATWNGSAFTVTGSATTNSTIILSAWTTYTFVLKLNGVTSSNNVNSVRTLNVTDLSYKDSVDNQYSTSALAVGSYNNVWLPVSANTTY